MARMNIWDFVSQPVPWLVLGEGIAAGIAAASK
jgi:hypothetical protein